MKTIPKLYFKRLFNKLRRTAIDFGHLFMINSVWTLLSAKEIDNLLNKRKFNRLSWLLKYLNNIQMIILVLKQHSPKKSSVRASTLTE